MDHRGAPASEAISAARVVLPDPAGPSTQISLPLPSVGGRDRASSRTSLGVAHGRVTSVPAAPVRRHLVDERVTGQQSHGVGVLEQLAGLRVPEPHQVADPQQRRRVPGQRGLHLAGALERGEVQPGRRPGDRRPVVADRARGDEAAAVHGRHRVGRVSGDRQAVERRGARGERLVVVEQAGHQQSRARGDLGDGGVGGRRLDRPGAAGVPELQLDQPGQPVGDHAPALGQLAHRGGLEPAYDERPGALRRHVVGDARRPGPRRSSPRPARTPRARRRAGRA